jgi:transcriptional antiterminator RfaH
MSECPLKWYLLQCKPNQQDRAQAHLDNQGFTTYAPQLKVERIFRRKRIVRDEAVFPGYLFIQLAPHSDWRALQATRGVSRLVSFNDAPHRIEDGLIAALRQQYNPQQLPNSLFKPGDSVRVTEGCFIDIQAIVKAVTSDERIIVLMNILQSQQAMVFPVTQLAKAG